MNPQLITRANTIMLRLNIIGCGNVGKSLGRLWTKAGVFEIGDILNRSQQSSDNAVKWIGSGRAIEKVESIRPADVFLITTSDDALSCAAEELSNSGTIKAGNIVLHCSGALSSDILTSLKNTGAHIASIHPVKSFATPCDSLSNFEGTFCGAEGDPQAREILEPAFTEIGPPTFRVDPTQKSL